MTSSTSDIQPYRVEIPQSDLDDLKERLRRMRWPDELSGAGWDYGVPLQYMRDLVDYAINQHNWRKVEARINEHPQFVTEIDGERVHFLHIKSREPNAVPFLGLLNHRDLLLCIAGGNVNADHQRLLKC